MEPVTTFLRPLPGPHLRLLGLTDEPLVIQKRSADGRYMAGTAGV